MNDLYEECVLPTRDVHLLSLIASVDSAVACLSTAYGLQ